MRQSTISPIPSTHRLRGLRRSEPGGLTRLTLISPVVRISKPSTDRLESSINYYLPPRTANFKAGGLWARCCHSILFTNQSIGKKEGYKEILSPYQRKWTTWGCSEKKCNTKKDGKIERKIFWGTSQSELTKFQCRTETCNEGLNLDHDNHMSIS